MYVIIHYKLLKRGHLISSMCLEHFGGTMWLNGQLSFYAHLQPRHNAQKIQFKKWKYIVGQSDFQF